ncbi:ketopantoate reductase family protein [Methylocella sp.]|uniref:ketopantoate reductase family protein n=1 Tax=Methylocella sp. TaxID=1978226 RepID=UPI003784FAC3
MRILVVGAGAIGGYFGARLLAAGRDVSFLVRPGRARQLEKTGLVVKSALGDVEIRKPPLISAERVPGTFDVVLLSCKAYDLDGAIEGFAPAVGARTLVLPLLNGMRHLDALDARFGAAASLGGLCSISTTLDAEGRILHFGDFHSLSYGPREAAQAEPAAALDAALAGAGFDARRSDRIMLEMWEKWSFIAAAAGITCLMRAAAGDMEAAGASDLAVGILDECAGVAGANGYPPREAAIARGRAMLTAKGSAFVASMLRDVEKGGRTEADHILGDLLRRAKAEPDPRSLLRIAYANLKSYDARKAREARL